MSDYIDEDFEDDELLFFEKRANVPRLRERRSRLVGEAAQLRSDIRQLEIQVAELQKRKEALQGALARPADRDPSQRWDLDFED